MPRPDMTTAEGRAGLSARLRRPVYRAYHAGMHADYREADDLVCAFEGLTDAERLRAICSEARAGNFQFALLDDGSKLLVEYTQVKV